MIHAFSEGDQVIAVRPWADRAANNWAVVLYQAERQRHPDGVMRWCKLQEIKFFELQDEAYQWCHDQEEYHVYFLARHLACVPTKEEAVIKALAEGPQVGGQ